MIPSLVEGKEELLTANVLSSITWSAMLALGAALGGLFAGLFGAGTALVADAVTFLVSAAFLFRLPKIRIEQVAEKTSGYSDLIAGFRYVIERPRVAALALVKSFGQIGSVDIFVVVFAEQYFPLGEEAAISLGILFGAMGLGAILGPMISNLLMGSSIPALRRAIHYGYLLVPIGWSLIAWSPTIWIVAAGALIRLMGTSINWTYSTALIQMEVPDRYRGRIFSFDLAMFTIATSSAVFLTGYFLDTLEITARMLGGYLAAGSVLPIFLWGLYRWWIRKPAAQTG